MSLEAHLKWNDHLPSGWHPLFEKLATALYQADEQAVIEQAKQKFGELRVYGMPVPLCWAPPAQSE